MKKRMYVLAAVAFSGLTALTSCSDNDDGNTAENGNAKMTVKMVDAPGDYDAVNVEVQGVVVKYADGTEVNLDVDGQVYDLLTLTGGTQAQLALNDEIPAGTINQIRLILGDNNTVVVDGETHALDTPSAQQSGLKLNLNETLEAGYEYEYILDFDVDQSVVEQGNGGFNLVPVIRASATAETGIIEGTVTPGAIPVLVTATSGNVEISTYTAADGSYAIYGVPEGAYTLTFTPAIDLGFDITVLSDVVVVNGEVEVVSEVTLDSI